MKKNFFTFILLTILAFGCFQPVKAMKFSEAMSSSKPSAVLIYATWADDINSVIKTFSAMQSQFVNDYNFIYLNIATEDTKEFNKRYNITTNLPYVMLFKDNGKISRYLQKNCITDSACFSTKLKNFIN